MEDVSEMSEGIYWRQLQVQQWYWESTTVCLQLRSGLQFLNCLEEIDPLLTTLQETTRSCKSIQDLLNTFSKPSPPRFELLDSDSDDGGAVRLEPRPGLYRCSLQDGGRRIVRSATTRGRPVLLGSAYVM